MRYLILILTIISFNLSGQGIEPSSFQPSPYLNGVLRAVTPIVDEFTGATNYLYVHTDSLQITGGSIDSTIVLNSYGTIITESPANTWNVKVDTSKIATQYDLTLITGGGGTVSSVDGTGGTGISVTGGPITTTGTLTITNTAPDQTVVLTEGGITDITGTYPNFTITSTEVDGSVSNEIQSLSLLDSLNRVFRLQISGSNTVKWKDQGITSEVDGDASNELQTISVTGTTTGVTTLSNSGGNMTIAAGGINTIGVSGSTITVTGTEIDGSITNEIQSLSLLDSINRVFRLQISDGNIVKFKDIDTNSGGTVTSITVNGPLTGGVITTTGTIGLDTTSITGVATQYDLTQINFIDSTIVTNGTGISVSESPNNTFTVTNTAPDQTVSITGAGITNVTGTYPNFTATSTEVDGSTTNEKITALTWNNAQDSLQVVENGVIYRTKIDGFLSSEVDGSITNEIQYLSLLDSVNRVFRLQISDGNTVKFQDTGITTEVDGSTTNELQTIAVTGTTTGITTLSNSGGSMTIAGAGINNIGVSGSTITITGTESDGSIINEGALSVGAGGANSSSIISNTLGSNVITISGLTGIEVTEIGNIISIDNVVSDSTVVNSGWGIDVIESPTNTYTLKADTSELVTQYDILGLGGLSGSGTTNYIPKWSSSTSLNNSLMYQSSQSLNIAYDDNSFSRGLTLQNTNTGTFAINGFSFKNSGGSTIANIEYYPTNYANSSIADFASVNTLGSSSGILFNTNAAGGDGANSGNIIFKTGGNTNPAIFIKGSDGSGYVGLGNTLPQKSLDVTGTLRVSSLDTDLTAPTTSGTTKTLISDANGDVSFIPTTSGTITSIATSSPITGGTITSSGTIGLDTTSATGAATQYDLTLKQATLVSGTNIKTVNSNSLLGSGNVSVGTVTGITASAPLTGGTITASGSIGVDTTSTTGLATQYDLTLISGGATDLSITGTSSPLTLNSSTGTDVTFTQGTGITLAGSSGNVTITNSDADQSLTNEGSLSVGAGSASTSIINSNTSGSGAITLSEGSGIDISESGNTITIANTGMTSLNGLSGTSQAFTWDASGSDFGISSTGFTHTFSLPTASGSNRGALSSSDWTTFSNKMGGTGSTNKVPYFTSSNALSFNSNFHWDNTNGRLGVGTSSPQTVMHVAGDATSGNGLLMQNKQAMATSLISQQILSIGSGSGYSSTERYYALKNTAVSSSASDFSIGYWNGGSETSRFKINSTGNVQIPFLAGSGTRMVITDASGWIDSQTIPTGTVSSIATNNGITGGTITTSGTIGLTGNALGLHNLGTNGILARTSSGNISARTITESGGISVTNGDGVSGNPTIESIGSRIVQINRTANLINTTAGAHTLNFTNQDVLLPSSPAPYTVDLGNDDILVTSTGTYEIIFSGVGSNDGGGTIYFEIWNGSSWNYINGVPQGFLSATYGNISFTELVQLSANNKVRVRYFISSGQTVTFDYSRLIVKRIR